jgi:hypothetical protein
MKKIFAFLAIAAMVAVGCSKTNDNGGKKRGGDDKPKYEQPITIDGNFDDWAKLDASKIATAKSDPDATKTALKLVKVYADNVFVFVYFEWDKDQISYEKDVEHVPFHVYINGDGNAATGGFADQWTDACTDVMMEGFIYPDAVLGSYEPGLFKWVGEANGSGWDPNWESLGDISGITKGAGVEGKYEFQITRELYPVGKLADNFSIGFDIQQGWNSVGILPNAAPTDDNPGGLAPSLQVVTVK